MNVAVNEMINSLLDRNDLRGSTAAELEQLTRKYPYFLPARLLYIGKLKSDGAAGVEQELRDTELWLPNTPWLEQLYTAYPATDIPVAVVPGLPADEIKPQQPIDEIPVVSVPEPVVDVYGNELVGEKPEDVEGQTADAPVIAEPGYEEDAAHHPAEDFPETEAPPFDPLTGLAGAEEHETTGEDNTQATVVVTDGPAGAEGPETPGDTFPVAREQEFVLQPASTEPEAETEAIAHHADTAHGVPEPETETAAIALHTGTAQELPEPETETAAIAHLTDTAHGLPDSEPGNGSNDIVAAPAGELPAGSSSSGDQGDEEEYPLPEEGESTGEIRIAPFRDEPMPENLEISFEPFHTVDYFASQGILAREDDKPGDRFSEQLKSFTQWLKAMKRVPGAATENAGGRQEERKIEEMASHSVQTPDIFTEAMAEVWEKQGNREKARAVYQKLSLLDPSKSAYFAAKIEQLNH